MDKICPHCGKMFDDPKHPDKKFCSHHCAMRFRAAQHRISKLCLVCGVDFGDKLLGSKAKTTQQYCSKKCEGIARRKLSSEKRTENRICAYCKQSFTTWEYRSTKYCSRECMGAARSHHGSIILNCKICGKEYTTKQAQVKYRGSNYCSRKCMGIGTAINKRGEKNVNYRGGTITYRGRNWGQQKRLALKRDSYRCQICKKQLGLKTWDYGVHHIKPYREFNGDYETANQLSNLITLCRSCHTKVEYGKLPCPMPPR